MGTVSVLVSDNLMSMGTCWSCGIHFAAPEHFVRNKRENGSNFFCPNGHSATYGKSETDKLKEEIERQKKATERARLETEAARATRDTARRAEAIAKGKLKAQSDRVKHGVCPCCQRTVRQLAAHMKTKHPDWNGEST